MMNERKYRRKYPDIADLLHNTDMTYAEIGRKIRVTKQYIQWLNKRLGQFGRPTKPKATIRKTKIVHEALKRFANDPGSWKLIDARSDRSRLEVASRRGRTEG